VPDIPIRLRNSLTRRVEPFAPIDASNVRMYVCGPTVYDRAHLGNARSAVVFDVLFRLLRHVYGADHVTYVRNITDIDDKIIARAAETGRPVEDITEETTRWYHEDMDALGCLRPTHEPRATDYLPQMIAMISALIEGGHAYEAEGHVLFSVASYEAYGRLSGRSVEDMIAGARVEVAPYKRDATDFVLWKPSADGVPGWDSPWGRGRPGWHIECSAMARDLLGGEFDIHGGGLDLQFPHHENEIAQSACVGDSLARVWVHNEMLMVDGRKMSKSLGNFFTVRDLLDQHISGETIRLALLITHYGKPADWTAARVSESAAHLANWAHVMDLVTRYDPVESLEAGRPASAVLDALSSDLNVSKAISTLRRLGTDARARSDGDVSVRSFFASLRLLGFSGEDPSALAHSAGIRASLEKAWSTVIEGGADTDAIEALLDRRDAAKQERDFGTADAIRDALNDAGIIVTDTADGVKWQVGPSFDPAKLEAIE
jgi:cysteinyl-tRNA synthetase